MEGTQITVEQLINKLEEIAPTDKQATAEIAEIIAALQGLGGSSKLLLAWQPTSTGLLAGIKNKIQNLVRNIVINLLSPYTYKQEQINFVLTAALVKLLEIQAHREHKSRDN
jgi:hypothetical protein